MLHREGYPGWGLWGVAVSEVAQAGTFYPGPHLQVPEPSDYILRFPGDVKESPNPYNQREPEFHGILEGKQRREHPQRRRGNIWNVLREQ